MHFYKIFFLCVFLFIEAFADDWSGIDYAKNSSVQLSHAEYLLSKLSFKEGDHILDVGCGDGKITALFAKKVPYGKVIGIDPSPSMLKKALGSYQGENIFFHEGAAETFSYEESFDHIIAIHVMHWVKEQARALKNIYHHLKPGGQVHIILAPSKEGLPFYTALQKTVEHWKEDFKDFENPQQVFDVEMYRKLLVEAGIHIEAMHYVYHESIHESKEKLISWIAQWLPYGKHLSLEKRSDFFQELLHNYLIEANLSTDTQGEVTWGEYVLIAEGKKN